MLAELSADPTSGLLGYQIFARPRGLYSVQYWNDPESIYRYASEPDAEHHPAWAAFNRRARKVPGAVGIFHETFPVRGAESMYVDMPEFGLGQAVGTVPVSGSLDRAAGRMARGRSNSASQSDAEQGH